jgi:hypothetical protein
MTPEQNRERLDAHTYGLALTVLLIGIHKCP